MELKYELIVELLALDGIQTRELRVRNIILRWMDNYLSPDRPDIAFQ